MCAARLRGIHGQQFGESRQTEQTGLCQLVRMAEQVPIDGQTAAEVAVCGNVGVCRG